MAAAIKMDELLVSWLGSDNVYENVLNLIETHRAASSSTKSKEHPSPSSPSRRECNDDSSAIPPEKEESSGRDVDEASHSSPRGVIPIPPFYRPPGTTRSDGTKAPPLRRRKSSFDADQTWDGTGLPALPPPPPSMTLDISSPAPTPATPQTPIKNQVKIIYEELGKSPAYSAKLNDRFVAIDNFVRITKEVCNFPTFFNGPLYKRILYLWNTRHLTDPALKAQKLAASNANKPPDPPAARTSVDPRGADEEQDATTITYHMFKWFWKEEMEDYDSSERFFRLLKQPDREFVGRDDFLPYIQELLKDHPGLEFLSNHAEFQEKYAVTVITRIFYYVNKCHSGKITSRQIRRSDLLSAFQQVDEEEDINKVTRYFSYEHFYVLYCRFWELDHDRDYRITREDLLKYGDHCLSHMIVDRIFDAAPGPFEGNAVAVSGADRGSMPASSVKSANNATAATNREYLTYEDFIFFMLSEEDKSNDISVRYWFSCIDVDGDGRLNNMEMRSFYAVQLHRMQCMGHEIVPFEDMLCQMIDMIKPANSDYLVVDDFLQPECAQVSGALFDALFNLNKYLQFEQRDPFMERQKREDEFETDWDRFACIDYNRLAMEEEQREEEQMEIDWVTVDDEDDDGEDFSSLGLGGASEAPF